MSGVDRLIPSVEEAAARLRSLQVGRQFGVANPLCTDECRERCDHRLLADIENAALALDMANAQASDARRAEADRLRAEVAW